jgi:phosphoserine aminotransferase
MSNKIFFTPGPSQLYPGVLDFMNEALEQDLGSISHRSAAFQEVYKEMVSQLRTLIKLPDNFHVLTLGSASESWERIIDNLSKPGDTTYHFTNGSFSQKFFDYSKGLGRNAIQYDAPFGEGFDITKANIPTETEVIAFTQNETSSGVAVPLEDIYAIRASHPEKIIAVDVVSTLPYPDFDYSKIDTLFFSVQKSFGLPAGLGVWIVNDRCIQKSKEIAESGHKASPHNNISSLLKMAEKNQTPSTPNTLEIALLGKVCKAMNEKGIEVIRKETDEKAQLLSEFIASSSNFDFAVKNNSHRSKTVIVAESKKTPAEINTYLKPHNIQIGGGYGDHKTTQIRIANFAATSVSQVKELIDLLKQEDKY